MDQPREVAKSARGQLHREIKCPCRCIRGKYIRTDIYFCLYIRYIFYLGTCTFVHGSLLYMHIIPVCVTTAVFVYVYRCSDDLKPGD